MVYFQTKNGLSGKFWKTLKWKMLVYFMVVWNILRSFGKFYGHSVKLWQLGIHIFPHLGILGQEKSANPGWQFLHFKKPIGIRI
jgi:hypothetical protein